MFSFFFFFFLFSFFLLFLFFFNDTATTEIYTLSLHDALPILDLLWRAPLGDGPMTKAPLRKQRCAVYTRKSSDEGLDMAFNSLDAQREACEAYIASQKPEGWELLDDRYDDGGVSGGTLDRPALKTLIADIEAGRIDVVVVYKIDRLSRSLTDFTKLVEVFDRHGVTFVSVTQSFNTTTSMGRLTLNILLSFAQFEREVTAERIRDKFAASRKKGMWMGGHPPLGYDVHDRKLVINHAEAATVRMIFERFLSVGSATILARTLAAEGVTTKRGKPIDKGALYKLLDNRVYIGLAVHKGAAYPGEHEAIIDRDLWDKVHAIIQTSPRSRANHSRARTPALLKGLVFGAAGRAIVLGVVGGVRAPGRTVAPGDHLTQRLDAQVGIGIVAGVGGGLGAHPLQVAQIGGEDDPRTLDGAQNQRRFGQLHLAPVKGADTTQAGADIGGKLHGASLTRTWVTMLRTYSMSRAWAITRSTSSLLWAMPIR